MTKNVIGFHYTLKDKEGSLIDTSDGQEPLLFLEGGGMLIPGLEKVLVTLNVGDKKEVEVKAADAYGELVQDLIVTVNKSQFPEDAKMQIGDQFQVNEDPETPIFTIKEIIGDDIIIDGNHPLAGIDLFFSIEITEKRAATADELSHGHAHGAGGHHH